MSSKPRTQYKIKHHYLLTYDRVIKTPPQTHFTIQLLLPIAFFFMEALLVNNFK